MSAAASLRGPRRPAILIGVAAASVLAALGSVVAAATLDGRGVPSRAPVGADSAPSAGQTLAQLNDPRASGLDPTLARQLAAIGVAVTKADVTGAGRDAFPGYWRPGAYTPCCSNIGVEAAGARPSVTRPGDVDVVVIWGADRSDGGPALRNQESTVHLHHSTTGWQPVPDPTGGP